tara:strand:- start:356 stop:706 length:351 start_codon:yes stop_codon:yes gene_type:complete
MLKTVRSLCQPAYVYLVISVIALVVLIFQNASNTNSYCVGKFECEVPNVATLFIAKGIYIVFWTFILNAICKGGGKNGRMIAWFLVLIPFLLMAIAIALMFTESHSKRPPVTIVNI